MASKPFWSFLQISCYLLTRATYWCLMLWSGSNGRKLSTATWFLRRSLVQSHTHQSISALQILTKGQPKLASIGSLEGWISALLNLCQKSIWHKRILWMGNLARLTNFMCHQRARPKSTILTPRKAFVSQFLLDCQGNAIEASTYAFLHSIVASKLMKCSF